MECISYKKGYKYQLVKEYSTKIPVKPDSEIKSPSGFIQLSVEGKLTIKKDQYQTPDFSKL